MDRGELAFVSVGVIQILICGSCPPDKLPFSITQKTLRHSNGKVRS